MKTIEEKAKAYDEVLNKLRHFITKGVDPLITRADVQDFFPELVESEDEKVEKAIFGMVYDSDNELWSSYDVSKSDVLAWLEKQGEQKPEENNGNIGGISLNWSDDDERMLDYVIGDILSADTLIGGKETASYKCDWLKSLKGRVQHQQEWSEEDEEILRTILSDGIRGAELDMLQVNWLKSLRPQPQWKPSDEQMEALWLYAEQNNYDGAVLTSLYNDLKKLKEGDV